jgi:hypothetical protein
MSIGVSEDRALPGLLLFLSLEVEYQHCLVHHLGEGKHLLDFHLLHHLPGHGLILQDMRAQSEMHLQQAGARPQARSLRRIPRSRAPLRRNAPIRESPQKEEGVGRAFVRRGQRLARDEKVPTAEAREGKHGSFADRLGPKREAPAGLRRPETEEASSGSSPAPAERQRLSDRMRSGASFEPLFLAANEGIFQQPGTFLTHCQWRKLLETRSLRHDVFSEIHARRGAAFYPSSGL